MSMLIYVNRLLTAVVWWDMGLVECFSDASNFHIQYKLTNEAEHSGTLGWSGVRWPTTETTVIPYNKISHLLKICHLS